LNSRPRLTLWTSTWLRQEKLVARHQARCGGLIEPSVLNSDRSTPCRDHALAHVASRPSVPVGPQPRLAIAVVYGERFEQLVRKRDMSIRVAVDTGGTFTDVVAHAGDTFVTAKAPTTPSSPVHG